MAGCRAEDIVAARDLAAPSVFQPENLLREGRRQRGLPDEPVPEVCVLDPDGDIVRQIRRDGRGRRARGWACYHTELDAFSHDGLEIGVVGCAVGAPFAVLVAEQLFVSGCRLLISVTSAGQIVARGAPPYFVLIDRALRDEGTSLHYLSPGVAAVADRALADAVFAGVGGMEQPVHRGTSWTTDAPYRETVAEIEAARRLGVDAVEMEAAALYAFAMARAQSVVCFAHVTNQMAVAGDDFEKGEDAGSRAAIGLVAAAAAASRAIWRR